MSLLTVLLVVLILVGLGVAVGSLGTLIVGTLIGVAAVIVLYASVGAVVAWRHPAHRDDGAPLRASR